MLPEARNDGEILAGIYHRLRELYRTEGGKGAEPLLKMSWRYKQPDHPESEEAAKRGTTATRWRISTIKWHSRWRKRPTAQ
ncbi:hypothetical protein MJ575_15835 [Klebsiella pneumoniae]|nr:hypothetical protein MJ575_15835 [Klebsiella pneumoniae]